jgi:predicted nucleotidyltransferase
MRRPTRREIAAQDRQMLDRQAQFRLAADAVTAALSGIPEVAAVVLIGSVARPLWREVPRFQPFRDWDVPVWHECKDVDLAVWLDRLDRLQTLNRARSMALHQLFKEKQIGVAHHQVEIFILQGEVNVYRGRLCPFSQCPKGKRECLVPGCGRDPFLQQHAGFTFWPDALAPDRIMHLYDRRRGILRCASEISAEGQDDHVATA